MSKWIAEFELEDGDTMPEHMDLNYRGARIDFHCRPLEGEPKTNIRNCKNCKYSKNGAMGGTEECHKCMWENKQEPKTDSDCISRAAAIECFFDNERYYRGQLEVLKDIEKLPSVNPQEPKTGHWEKSRDCFGNNHFICSECGNDIATQYEGDWDDNYCSICGAKMQAESKDKDAD